MDITDKIEYKNEDGNWLKGTIIAVISREMETDEGTFVEAVVSYGIETPHKDENDAKITIEALADDVRKVEK